MKKLILAVGVICTTSAFAQTFSDNFDSYTAGSPMAQQSGGNWTTWSNAPGGTEDVPVSNANAASMPNSIYFSTSTQNGGPTDLVKHFGVMNTGQFSLQFNMFVETGKAGYFNLQKTATLGQTWTMDCFFQDNGTMAMSNAQGLDFSASYPQNAWFNFRLDVNFNTNVWEVFIDNVSAGTFANPINQVEAIDIFPVDGNSPYSCGYYIDDFQYTVTPYTLPSLNGAATYVTTIEGAIAGAVATPKVTIRNLGTTTINTARIDVDYNGNNINTMLSSLNLASLASTTITMPSTFTFVAGQQDMVATISQVNGGGADGDASDDATTMTYDPIIPAVGKMVVVEEATGTWCQYCPRGAVYMEMMSNKYPEFFAGIAVHNNDPMTVTAYDAAMGQLITGYPSALADRMSVVDPSQIEQPFLDRLVVAPTAFIIPGATWDSSTRTLNVSISADFQSAANNNYKLAVVLTEDEVTGTTSAYNQSNAFSGGSLGPMGGFESLPNPVPASQMVYDHVARNLVPSFSGFPNSFPATVNAGETHTVNATFVLPASWDETKINIIGMLINPAGKIDNAGKATITEAVANGFVSGTDMTVGIEELDQVDATLQVYPNPATTSTTIALNLKSEGNVVVTVRDINGKVMATRNYGLMNGASTITVPTADYAKGVYMVEVSVDAATSRKTLIIE